MAAAPGARPALALPRCADGEAAALCRAWADSRARFRALLVRTQAPRPAECAEPAAQGCFRDGTACSCKRVLEVTVGSLDGFALECQTLGRALRMALASGRMMVVNPSWCSNYASRTMRDDQTPARPWGCLWNHTNACQYRGTRPHHHEQLRCAKEWHASHPYDGIAAKSSPYFNTRFHGPSLVQRLFLGDFPQGRFFINSYDHALAKRMGDGSAGEPIDPIPSNDAVPDWERRFGGFWVRAQIQDFLWRPAPLIAQAVAAHPAMGQVEQLVREGLSYIGCAAARTRASETLSPLVGASR